MYSWGKLFRPRSLVTQNYFPLEGWQEDVLKRAGSAPCSLIQDFESKEKGDPDQSRVRSTGGYIPTEVWPTRPWSSGKLLATRPLNDFRNQVHHIRRGNNQ